MNPCAARLPIHIFFAMKRLIMLALVWLATANVFAQDATALAAQREAAEFERRMVTRTEELTLANNTQQKRINELREEVGSLRRQVTELENKLRLAQNGAVTGQDLRKVYDKMGEMEKARSADKELILEQMKKLKEIASQPPVVITQAPPPVVHPKPTVKPEPEKEKEPELVPEFTGEYFPYKIKSGDTLTAIISAYNTSLKEQGKGTVTLDQVKKANPKINPNNLLVGRELKIPVPSNK